MQPARERSALSLGIVWVGLAAVPAVTSAHHSGAMFDRDKTVVVAGIVREFNWTNPHASFKVEVAAAGDPPVVWAIEMNAPNNLLHEGWKRTTIKAGDAVTVLLNPLRDGRPGGWYLAVRLANGTTIAPAGSDYAKALAGRPAQ